MLQNGAFRFVSFVFLTTIFPQVTYSFHGGKNATVHNVLADKSSLQGSSAASSTTIASNSGSGAPDTLPKTTTFVTDRSTETLFSVTFTPAPNATGIAEAKQCWNQIMTWGNSSAAWFNANIYNRTWSMGPVVTSDTISWSSSTTIYPSSVSTYTLCDGTPRANVRPITHHFSGNSTTTWTMTDTLTPKFTSQPCTPDPEMCRMWYYDSNIPKESENELIRQCGLPAHQGAPCLIGGGPVQLVYFPVTTVGGNLCGHNGSTVPIPTGTAGPDIITTLGHTFTSGSVYLSFKSLYASYDGFWDRIGPTFSDFILPVPSSAVSTQCGGWGNAHGPGTPINYADLNWPVPASAYSCQDRCSVTLTSKCASCTYITVPPPPECNTIWSDIDPVLAVPTQVRSLVPEWSTCSFWDLVIPNFFFDPPIALHQQGAPVTPTWASPSMTSTPAPRSTAQDPLPKNTATAVHTGAGGDPQSTQSPHNDPSPSSQPGGPSDQSQDPAKQTGPDLASEPVISILAHALSSNIPETDPAMKTIVSKAHSIADSILHHHDPEQTADPPPGQEHSITGAIVTVSGTTLTAVQSSGYVVIGSNTLKVGQSATISGTIVSAGSTGIVVGSKTAALTPLPASPSYATIPFSPVHTAQSEHLGNGMTMFSAGSVTLTASALGLNEVMVDGTTLWMGGPEATISGYIVTEGSKGLAWLSPMATGSSEGSLPPVVTNSGARGRITEGQTGVKSSTAAPSISSTSTSGASRKKNVVHWQVWLATISLVAILCLI